MTTLIARVTRDLKVTYHPSVRAAQAKGNNAWLVDSAEALNLRTDLSTGDMAKLFSQLSGNEVKRFSDRPTASKRLWAVMEECGKTFLAEQPEPEAVVEVVQPEKKAKAEPKPKREKKEKKEKDGGRTTNMDKRLYPVSDKNPYRPTSKSGVTFELILANPGKTTREYVEIGGRLNTLRDAIREQHVRCE